MAGVIIRLLRAITGRSSVDIAAIRQFEWQDTWDRSAGIVRAAIESSWRAEGLDPADPVLLRALNVEVTECMRTASWDTITGHVFARVEL
jgi:hypothetical protein